MTGAYLLVVMGTYVVEGIRTVGQDGLDHKKALIVGLAFSVGVAMENSDIIPSLPGAEWLLFLDNGLAAGTVAAVLMTWFVELTSPRARQLEAPLDNTALTELYEFLGGVARGTRLGPAFHPAAPCRRGGNVLEFGAHQWRRGFR